MTPEISVLMGVLYRKDDTAPLLRAVESILEQSFSNFEFLICDDGSNAAAVSLLDELSARDERIYLIRGRNKHTLPEKLNECLRHANAPWIVRMDDDDYSHPDRFERQLAWMRDHPDSAFLGCNVALICGGEVVGKRTFPEFPQIRDFYMTQPFIHPSLLFRREALDAIGGYSEDKHCLLCEDYDLLLRLYEHGYRGANLQEVLFDYTIPLTARGNRRMSHRWNEVVTRWRRFGSLGVLPKALPYVIKPILVGLLPEKLLAALKGT